jgi:SAM-dependent methyltransferase
MIHAFDHIAADYDREFTLSETGMLQRKRVLDYIEKAILKNGHCSILELNCGTGEDAIYFYNAGNEVFATDSSAGMIRIAKAKTGPDESKGIGFMQLSFAELPLDWMKGKFDLVFSNFGGMNCIDQIELKLLIKAVKQTLKPGGRFVGVIMPRYCLWEILYFSLKGRFKKVFRRKKSGPVEVMLGAVPVKTWYYSPKQIKRLAVDMEMVAIRPIGLALPPSGLESFFRTRKRTLKFLWQLEKKIGSTPFLAGVSDHFLFDMVNSKEL